MSWAVYQAGDIKHVIPLRDLEPHFKIPDCHCGPKNHPETTDSLVVHNAFDRREINEAKQLAAKALQKAGQKAGARP